jgi:hypothetical protein
MPGMQDPAEPDHIEVICQAITILYRKKRPRRYPKEIPDLRGLLVFGESKIVVIMLKYQEERFKEEALHVKE